MEEIPRKKLKLGFAPERTTRGVEESPDNEDEGCEEKYKTPGWKNGKTQTTNPKFCLDISLEEDEKLLDDSGIDLQFCKESGGGEEKSFEIRRISLSVALTDREGTSPLENDGLKPETDTKHSYCRGEMQETTNDTEKSTEDTCVAGGRVHLGGESEGDGSVKKTPDKSLFRKVQEKLMYECSLTPKKVKKKCLELKMDLGSLNLSEMETEALSNYTDPEEGEILNDDPEELYIPLERPHISSGKAAPSTSLPPAESDDENALKESSSDSDSSDKNVNSSKIRRKAFPAITKPSGGKKKNYNIWSGDIQTEVLTNSLVDCNVDQNIDRCRNVESYNYKLSNNENEFKNSFVKSKNPKEYSAKRRHDGCLVQEKIKNKNPEKQKKCPQSSVRNILSLSTGLENSEEEIARDIANKLCEEKEDLILRALNILGKEFIISLFEETKNIEGSGGIMVMNGTRRRTPGGVFFYLLKTSESVPRDKINLVLSEDKKTRTDEKKQKAKKNRQLQAEKFKKSLTEDDFPTLLSRTELAIKEFKARKLAEDSGEVKNPPPSPATDRRECGSDGEEQKEGNESTTNNSSSNSVKKATEHRTLTTYDDNLFDNEEYVMDMF